MGTIAAATRLASILLLHLAGSALGLQPIDLHNAIKNWNVNEVMHIADVKKLQTFMNEMIDGVTPLYRACKNGMSLEVIEKLLDAGADRSINTRNGTDKETVLHVAVQRDVTLAEKLISRGAIVTMSTHPDGLTPLYLFMHAQGYDGGKRFKEEESIRLTKTLIEKGADVNAETTLNKMTPLLNAVNTTTPGVIKVLLEHKAEVFHANVSGWTTFAFGLQEEPKRENIAAILGFMVQKTYGPERTYDLVKERMFMGAGPKKKMSSAAWMHRLRLLCVADIAYDKEKTFGWLWFKHTPYKPTEIETEKDKTAIINWLRTEFVLKPYMPSFINNKYKLKNQLPKYEM